MLLKHYDQKYHFQSVFDTITGNYMRTGVLDENRCDTGVDPFMASFPELIDIGIMGHCMHGLSGKCKESGVQCYQHGDITQKDNMTLADYKYIIDQCVGKTYQVALGGCGDPDMHENFKEILQYTRLQHIIPNFTTSGFGMTPEKAQLCKQYCGAVAVSWYGAEYSINTIQMLLAAGVTTNIHYVLGNNSVDKAIDLLKNGCLEGLDDKTMEKLNAVIFLLHKPVGLGQQNNVLTRNDPRVQTFFGLVDSCDESFPVILGFDSCTVPGLVCYTSTIDPSSIDFCEAARWSMYITPDLKGLPCSFDNQGQRYAVDIRKEGGIQKVWDSPVFENFRKRFQESCLDCEKRIRCYGGCPLMKEIILCDDFRK